MKNQNAIITFFFAVSVSLFAATYPSELRHGPMLGGMTDTSVRCAVGTASAVSVQFRVSTSAQMTSPIYSDTQTTVRDNGPYSDSGSTYNYHATMEVTGLQPDTQYYYEVLVNGTVAAINPLPSFKTFPSQDARTIIKIAFGGGAANPSTSGVNLEHMWDSIRGKGVDALLLLGDNVYSDKTIVGWSGIGDYQTRREQHDERNCSVPYRDLISTRPVYAIWDDHDFCSNDGWCEPPDGMYSAGDWRPGVWQIFKENFNNPSYGGNDVGGVQGCWFNFSIGMVDFFMLDGRYYRTQPQPAGAGTTMLGSVQKQWLKDKLSASTATFKVIASPVPWHDQAKGLEIGRYDTWRGFPNEREEIFAYIRNNNITGVILMSADRHRGDVVRNHNAPGYDLYEFENSRLTNVHAHPQINHPDWVLSYSPIGFLSKRVWPDKQMFGMLTFDLTQDDPTITYHIVDIDGNIQKPCGVDVLPASCELTVYGSEMNVPPLGYKADLDNDGEVDLIDFSTLTREWMDTGIWP
jgi:alkaline phosphatase D